MRRWYLGLVSVYALLRLGELALSRRHERLLGARVPRRRERGFHWMVAAHLVPFVLGPIEASLRRNPSHAIQIGAAIALAGAAMLRAWVLASLGPSWSVHVRAAPSMRIVDRGPYRFVRHPNYTAVIIELAALPLVGGAYCTAAIATLLDAVALWIRVRDEEAALGASSEWRRLMSWKPRFVPRLIH